MSAGSGVRHSEFNGSASEPVHFLQIWIQPDVKGIPPSYQETTFAPEAKLNQLRLIASPDGRDGSLLIHQDAAIYATILRAGHTLSLPLAAGRTGYVHVATGQANVNGTRLGSGDALKFTEGGTAITLSDAIGEAEILVFDLPY
jgi:redox-sensitive bicupin YhaK (pirin superfamily)